MHYNLHAFGIVDSVRILIFEHFLPTLYKRKQQLVDVAPLSLLDIAPLPLLEVAPLPLVDIAPLSLVDGAPPSSGYSSFSLVNAALVPLIYVAPSL